MYKKFLVKCMIKNLYKGSWHNEDFYFDTREEVIDFINNGTKFIKPENIRIEAIFKLKKIDIEL